ncbi:PTI1-like tyrosine-protein kinase 3 [Zea mays]|nr:PTI1-like tyrosine-protein kinase 3 [Zea mays]
MLALHNDNGICSRFDFSFSFTFSIPVPSYQLFVDFQNSLLEE